MENVQKVFFGDEDVEYCHSQLQEEELVGKIGNMSADLQANIAYESNVSQLEVGSQNA